MLTFMLQSLEAVSGMSELYLLMMESVKGSYMLTLYVLQSLEAVRGMSELYLLMTESVKEIYVNPICCRAWRL